MDTQALCMGSPQWYFNRKDFSYKLCVEVIQLILVLCINFLNGFLPFQRRPPPPLPPPQDQVDKQEGDIAIAMFDFHPMEPHDLRLTIGEEYVVLEKKDVHWWKARNKYG